MVFSLEQKAELVQFDYNFFMIFIIDFCLVFYFVEKIYILGVFNFFIIFFSTDFFKIFFLWTFLKIFLMFSLTVKENTKKKL